MNLNLDSPDSPVAESSLFGSAASNGHGRRRRQSHIPASQSKQADGKVTVYSIMTDAEFDKMYMGEQGPPESHYNTIVDSDCEVWGMDEGKVPRFLMRYKKKAFTTEEQQLARYVFEGQAKQAQSYRRRGSKTQGQSMEARRTAHSMIAGYWDRRDAPTSRKLSLDDTFQNTRDPDVPLPNAVCRTTAFTANNQELWNKGLGWLQSIAREHRSLAPAAYDWQLEQTKKCLPSLIIPNTPYSTLTVNYNWSTNIHKDSGDLGLGNLAVVGTEGDWAGCWFCMPRFKLAVKAIPGSFLVADVHEFHCNTPLIQYTPTSVRLSFVAYLRDKMHECSQQLILDSGEVLYVP